VLLAVAVEVLRHYTVTSNLEERLLFELVLGSVDLGKLRPLVPLFLVSRHLDVVASLRRREREASRLLDFFCL
jgi:hypothetical protein